MNRSKPVCLCSSSLPEEMLGSLEKDFRVIPLPPDSTVDAPVSCHPDMICSVMDSTVFFHRSYAEAYPSVISEIQIAGGYRTVLTSEKREKAYPLDISLNAAVLPDTIVCRAEYTSPDIIRAASESGRKVVSVRQGYSACSSLVCGRSVLTTDRGIHRSLISEGFDCTYIQNSGISLPGYDCGFIGGCGGIYERSLYLFGCEDCLDDRDTLRQFAEKNGLAIVNLGNAPLTDYGGLKFLS